MVQKVGDPILLAPALNFRFVALALVFSHNPGILSQKPTLEDGNPESIPYCLFMEESFVFFFFLNQDAQDNLHTVECHFYKAHEEAKLNSTLFKRYIHRLQKYLNF